MSAATASNARPALASSILRARLCEARINEVGPRQSVMLFGEPVPLPVSVEFENRCRGFFDRAPGDVELRPIEFRGETLCVSHFVGDRLAIDVILVVRAGTDAE